MESNQTIENAPAPAPTPVSVPEQDMMATGVNEKKKGKGMLYGMILCAVLAIGGIGFGVWAMMDGNDQKGAYEEQISNYKKQINELQEKINNITDNTGAKNNDNVDESEYISVEEWGIKVKIPDNLEDMQYSYSPYSLVENLWGYTPKNEIYTSSLCVTGATKKNDGLTPSFVGLDKASVCVSRNRGDASVDEDAPWPLRTPSGEYYVQGPQAVMGDGSDAEWESESVKVLKEMLSEENFIAI